MILEAGIGLLAFFVGVYWRGKYGNVKSNKNCYVCGKFIGTESSVTDHKRNIFYHFGCWAGVVKHDVFNVNDESNDI